jgi:hypothetical protein
MELAMAFLRFAFGGSVLSLLFFMLAGDKLSHGIRGAMCAYGVFNANDWGFIALYASLGTTLVAGWLSEMCALDGTAPTLELTRPIARGTLLLAPVSVAALGLSTKFLASLDLTVVSSCCSVALDSEGAGYTGYAHGPRTLVTALAIVLSLAAVVAAAWARRSPGRGPSFLAGTLSLSAVPFAIGTAVLEVAPHAFESPHHLCPFCLFRSDVYGLGYALFAAILAAAVWGGGLALGAGLSRSQALAETFGPYARRRLGRGAIAWMIFLLVGAMPVARYAVVGGGAPLFR